MQVEVRGDKAVIDGYVNAVGRDSRPIRCQTGDFVEQVEPGVFGKALKRAKNIKLLLNHRTDRELGSTADGNLTLTEDSIGLRAHAEIGDEEVIRKARNHQLSGWSFGMYVNESEMEQRSNAIPRRKLKDIDMFEVSVIDTTMLPCYAGTSVECRAEGENAALLETRAYDDTVEVTENLPENYFDDAERQLEQLRAESDWLDAEKRLEELRYNPYHDPTNGRFTTSSGGSGGYLFVGKGEKGKGQYVIDSKEFKPKIKSYQQKAMDRMNEILSKDKTISKMPEYTILDSGNIEFKYEKTEIFTKEKGGKMPDPANADTIERISEVTGTILVDEKGNRKIFGKRHNTISEKVIKKGKRTSVKNTKSSNKNSSDVSVFVINEGTPSQFFGIKTADGEVLHAPNNWKTEKGALRWAEKNGYAVSRAFGDNDIDYAEEQLAQLRAESDWLDAEKRLGELRYNPYHDPTNGRFTTSSGGGGGYLFVGKGEKGKGQYVYDRDIDSEYEEWKKQKKSSKRELDATQIDRANAQGSNFYEAGTAIKNTYDREYDEIENLNISDEEKSDARNKIYEYSSAELEARQKYFDVYTAGPARKVSGSDKALDKSQKIRGEHENYMASLRDKSSKNTYKAQKEKEAELFRKAGAEADKTGAREITVNGETWFRTAKTSKTWTKGTLKDYKAQQAYNKTQKDLWMGARKPWSSLTEEEKKPFYRANYTLSVADAEKRLEELRYNPYHDPTNGRFTTSSGSGGYLFVGKGQKGNGQYVFDTKKSVADTSTELSERIKNEFIQKGLNSNIPGIRKKAEEGAGNYKFKNAEPVSASDMKMSPMLNVHEHGEYTLIDGYLRDTEKSVYYANKTNSREIQELLALKSERKEKELKETAESEAKMRDFDFKNRTTTTYNRWRKNDNKKFVDWYLGTDEKKKKEVLEVFNRAEPAEHG